MVNFVAWIAVGISIVTLVPATMLVIEVLASFLPQIKRRNGAPSRPRAAVLVPAHDEASGIGATLATILKQLRGDDILLVVADNCSDNTAEIAKGMGATVVVRNDPSKRGKGYALNHGIRLLDQMAEHPDVVIVIDADCQPGDGCIDTLARFCAASNGPVQAKYVMEFSGTDRNAAPQFHAFAWTVATLVRPLGLRRLALPCHLMGTGMAFPWKLIVDTDLGTGHIVEDLKLGIDLARRGHFCLFCPEVEVTSAAPAAAGGIKAQRRRWEHGSIATRLYYCPVLFWEGVKRLSPRLVAMGLDLSTPPLSLLVLVTGVAFGLSLLASWFVGDVTVLFPSLLSGFAIAFAVALAWYRYGRQILSLAQFATIPAHVMRKVPLYLEFLYRREQNWVRTSRDRD